MNRDRRLEDKFDAKGLKQHTISIRCSPPHGKRRLPLHFDGWVLMPDTGGENLFSNCLLVQHRPAGLMLVYKYA